MRATLGPALAHLALLGAGFGVLRLTGQLAPLSPGRLLASVGLAYMAGVAAVMTALIVLMVIGVGISLPLFAVVCALFALPAAVAVVRPANWSAGFARRRRRLGDLRALSLEHWGAAAIVAFLAVVVITGISAARHEPLDEFDNFLIWANKAVVLYHYGDFPAAFLSSTFGSGAHWDYPILLPMLEAVQFKAAASPTAEPVHVVPWLLLAGFAWAAAFLVRRSTRPAVWAGVLGGLVVLVVPQLTTGLADTPMACFLALGALAIGLWIQEGRTSDLAIGAVMLAGAAGTKTEGAFGAAVVIAVAVAVHLAWRNRRAAGLTAVAGIGLAAIAVLPWQLWILTHDIAPTTRLGTALDPSHLGDTADRVWPSTKALYAVLATEEIGQFTVALAVALIIVRMRGFPRIAVFYLGVALLYFASLVWAYWVTPLDLDFLINTSAARIHVGIVFLAAVAILHLGGALLREPEVDGERVVPDERTPEQPAGAVTQPLA
jgi:hypothetical protein